MQDVWGTRRERGWRAREREGGRKREGEGGRDGGRERERISASLRLRVSVPITPSLRAVDPRSAESPSPASSSMRIRIRIRLRARGKQQQDGFAVAMLGTARGPQHALPCRGTAVAAAPDGGGGISRKGACGHRQMRPRAKTGGTISPCQSREHTYVAQNVVQGREPVVVVFKR